MLSRPERHRPHAVRRHLLQREPGPDLLGQAPPRHGPERLAGRAPRSAPGPSPIETTEGWLLIYHGVLTTCNGFVYSFGAALLDLDQPWKVIARDAPVPARPAEALRVRGRRARTSSSPAPRCATPPTGRMAIYYGAADTVTGLAFAYVDELVEFAKTSSF